MTKENLNKKGFTLIEMLVVVLIIGILAAIALPQYQMAVGRSKLSTLKEITHSLASAAQRYYMVHNSYEGISINKVDVEIPSGSNCYIWRDSNYLRCCKEIFNTNICYFVVRDTGQPLYCFVVSSDINDKANRLCQQDTNTQIPNGYDTNWNRYKYKNL